MFKRDTILESPHGGSPPKSMKCDRGLYFEHGRNLRCLRAVESVKGSMVPFLYILNNGSLSVPGKHVNIVLSAVTGHISECPKLGIAIIHVSFLFCIVFDLM